MQHAAVGRAGSLRSEYRQAALGGGAWQNGLPLAGGIDQLRRADSHRGRTDLHRGRTRSASACVRRRYWQGSVDRGTASQRAIDAYDISMGRQAIHRNLRGRARKDEKQDGGFGGGLPAGVIRGPPIAMKTYAALWRTGNSARGRATPGAMTRVATRVAVGFRLPSRRFLPWMCCHA